MRTMFTAALIVAAALLGLAGGFAQANCGPAHPCEGSYCTR